MADDDPDEASAAAMTRADVESNDEAEEALLSAAIEDSLSQARDSNDGQRQQDQESDDDRKPSAAAYAAALREDDSVETPPASSSAASTRRSVDDEDAAAASRRRRTEAARRSLDILERALEMDENQGGLGGSFTSASAGQAPGFAAAVPALASSAAAIIAESSAYSTSSSSYSASLKRPADRNLESSSSSAASVTNLKSPYPDGGSDSRANAVVGEGCHLLCLPKYFLQTSILPYLHPAEVGDALSCCKTTSSLARSVWKSRLMEAEAEARGAQTPAALSSDNDTAPNDAGDGDVSALPVVADTGPAGQGPVGMEVDDDDHCNDSDERSARMLKRLYRRQHYLNQPMFSDPFTGHTGRVTAAVPMSNSSSGQRTFVTASYDGTLRSWAVATGDCVHKFVGHSGMVHGLDRLDDDHFVSGGGDRMGKPSAKLWDSRSGQCVRTFIGHADDVMSVARLAGSASASTSASAERSTGNKKKHSDKKQQRRAGAMAEANATFVTAGMDVSAKLWDAQTGQCVHGYLAGGANGFVSVVSVRDGVFATSDTSRGVSVWKVGKEKRVHYFPDSTRQSQATGGDGALPAGPIANSWKGIKVVSCGDGCSILASSGPRELKRYNVDTGQCMETFDTTLPFSAMVRMDNRLYVFYSFTAGQNLVGIWDIDMGSAIHHFVAEQRVSCLSRLDEVTFVVGYLDGAVELHRIPEECLVEIADEEV